METNPVAHFVNRCRALGFEPMRELKNQAAGAVARARKAGKSEEVIRGALTRAARTRRFDLWGSFIADEEVTPSLTPDQAWQAVCRIVTSGGSRRELPAVAQAAWLEAFGQVGSKWVELTDSARWKFMQAYKREQVAS